MRLMNSIDAGTDRRGPGHALELLPVHEAEQRRDALAARRGVVERAVQQFGQRRLLAGGARQLDGEARGRERAVHVQQQQPLATAAARQDVLQRRRGLALRLEHRRDLLGVQAAGGAGARVDDARDLVGHHRQVVQRLAVVLQRADVDLGQPRPGAVGVDEQADVDAVAVLERSCCSSERRAAMMPPSGWPKPASSGKKTLSMGLAVSSVTRPPPRPKRAFTKSASPRSSGRQSR